ncbi:MAG: amidohydrolase [Pseudomonadota bacterium]|nr:amidohydrolase [Pseudomonadota bacterium]
MDAHGGVVHFNGIVIGNDGRIVQVLHRGEKRPTRVDFAVDEHGRTAIPGLIDAHAHVMELGFAALTLDLSNARSLAEAQGRIAAYASAHPDRGWIVGRGWDAERWQMARALTVADLDAVVVEHPVWLVSTDGHAGWANSKALALAHVSALTRDPPGGRIERGVGGRPSGVLVDGAMTLVGAVIPPPRAEDRDLAFINAQAILLKHGITAVTDMGTTIEDWQTYRRAGDSGALAMRIIAYADGVEAMALIGGPGPTPWLYDDRLRLNGVSLTLDGTLAQHSALLKAPYADDPANRGLSRLSETQLKNLMSRAAIDHFQVAIHAAGDAAGAEALGAIADLAQTYHGDRRWRIEDSEIVDPADLAQFGAHGVVATMLPDGVAAARATTENRLGPARVTSAYPWQSIAATGAILAIGTDAAAGTPDPFAALATAITRQTGDAQPAGGWQPQEKLAREAALAGVTSNAAYAGFADGHFGRIEVGQRADFLLIDRDPLLASPGDLRATQVLEMWIGGRKVQG